MKTPELPSSDSEPRISRPKSAKRPSTEYRSRFQKWDEKSWVRSKPHQLKPFEPSLYYYSEAVAALFSHSVVQTIDDTTRRELLVLHLFNYLEFTVWLEMGPVNEVCDLLRRPHFLPWLPSQMKNDALKIYVDEGGHAEMSQALFVATEQATGVESLKVEPAFLGILDRLVRNEEPEYMPIIKLFFTIISETLITGTLVQLPKDPLVQEAVRELAADHATDESRHHAYFRQVFEYVWPRFPGELRRKLGSLIPDMILAFLSPDTAALKRMLERYPAQFTSPSRIVQEIVTDPRTKAGILESASPTLKMLADNGVFTDEVIAQAFQQRGLYE